MSLISIFHKVGFPLIHKLQSILGIITIGSRAIVLNKDNQVLLVKHTYQSHWYLPGGGVKRGETVKSALLRELKEEVGLITKEEPKLFGIYFNNYSGVNDYPIIFIIKNYDLIKIYSHEIEAFDWFSYEALPEMVSPGTQRRLDEYFNHFIQADIW